MLQKVFIYLFLNITSTAINVQCTVCPTVHVQHYMTTCTCVDYSRSQKLRPSSGFLIAHIHPSRKKVNPAGYKAKLLIAECSFIAKRVGEVIRFD